MVNEAHVVQTLDALQVALGDQQAMLDVLRAAIAPGVRSSPELVTIKDAARRLGVHERTARRWAKAGVGTKLYGRWRLDLSQLQRGGHS